MGERKLTPEHQQVLSAWTDVSPELGFLPFRAVAKRSGVEDYKIRRIVRHLARKGLLQFEKGLWNDDGPAGAGYGLTDAGRAALRDGGQDDR